MTKDEADEGMWTKVRLTEEERAKLDKELLPGAELWERAAPSRFQGAPDDREYMLCLKIVSNAFVTGDYLRHGDPAKVREHVLKDCVFGALFCLRGWMKRNLGPGLADIMANTGAMRPDDVLRMILHRLAAEMGIELGYIASGKFFYRG